jgi:hypothetical protein
MQKLLELTPRDSSGKLITQVCDASKSPCCNNTGGRERSVDPGPFLP